MDEAPEKTRKPRSDKGKKRGPKAAPMFTQAIEDPAPINVRVTLRNGAAPVEFGCARRFIENGFHVFFYPSKTDPYRETRREFAISEIVEIEITEARQSWYSSQPESITTSVEAQGPATLVSSGPRIHSVRKNAATILGQLEQATGSIKMDTLPNLNIGGAPRPVTFGDSEA